MRTPILVLACAVLQLSTAAQCVCEFGRTGDADTIAFMNYSSVENAHYYWSFGDGSGSNEVDPTHVFTASGRYLVTLYGRDTLGSCHTYVEEWIDVVKPSTDPCQPGIVDSVFIYDDEMYIMMTETSVGCNDYAAYWGAGPSGGGGSFGFWSELGAWPPGLFIGRVTYSTSDSIDGSRVRQAYQLTSPAWFDRSLNYGGCSANFEVLANYGADSARFTFTAMSPYGVDTFFVYGLGNPYPLVGHSVSYTFPYITYAPEFSWLVEHTNTDDCATRCVQEIVVRNPHYVTPVSCAIATQPQAQVTVEDGIAQFTIETQDGSTKQWQQDAGLGWQNLTNAGPFSGVNSDTLTVANVQSWWNNNRYRCVVSNPLNGCHNTSEAVALFVAVGMAEPMDGSIRIHPNPASGVLWIQRTGTAATSPMSITDALGRIVHQGSATGTLSQVDVGHLDPGAYVFHLIENGHSVQHRFIKE